jgi:hypothetical protein
VSLHNTTPFGCLLSFLVLGVVIHVLSKINWMAVGIAILLLAFVAAGIAFFSKKPSYPRYPEPQPAILTIRPTQSYAVVVTKKLVTEVKAALAGGSKPKTIAKEKGISLSTVYKIRRNGYDENTLPD